MEQSGNLLFQKLVTLTISIVSISLVISRVRVGIPKTTIEHEPELCINFIYMIHNINVYMYENDTYIELVLEFI